MVTAILFRKEDARSKFTLSARRMANAAWEMSDPFFLEVSNEGRSRRIRVYGGAYFGQRCAIRVPSRL
jgi:hypothetical protein